MKIVELEDSRINKYLNDFYSCFDTGYDFEDFLKYYLEKLGLDEIEVTKRSRDGGIDLIAVRNGVGEFSNTDAVHYYIQAKRYKPGSKIRVGILRELKGVIPFGHKGMLITTADFTDDVYAEADNDASKPVTLVNGETLLRSCIENEIGFTYEPKFSKEELKRFIKVEPATENIEINENDENFISLDKEITENDVRAKIISVPSKIAALLEDRKEYKIIFENDEIVAKFIKGRNYFSAGLPKMYRKYGLLSDENIICSKKATWKYQNDVIYINIK